ncbi:DUF3040 domain-containing protein [Arthrobacter sulfonylureivorans]|uniref:DUF3040 domain-containing protein n=1 Tax=Arthrobacter sulfonylureivorans TaxID=2486855 RepID=A0ABY3WF07_9MICC|nr:DUF3040 domain-containing protein [Arthrobacter sulfonylureivorans]UNK46279.1 DUF3040 domain-containing protein [Arthrobacter sulfonylureivorans]
MGGEIPAFRRRSRNKIQEDPPDVVMKLCEAVLSRRTLQTTTTTEALGGAGRKEMWMPLSPEEQKQLEAIEHYLSLDDPDLAQKLRSGSHAASSNVRNVWVPLMLPIVIMALPVGIAAKLAVVALTGFILAAAGVYGVLSNSRLENPQGGTRNKSREEPERR